MLYQIFLSRQMKWCAIISYKHGIYKLSHELPNDLEFVSNILWMVVGYRLHIYVGYYLNFGQAMLVSVIQMRLMNKVLRKQKIMVHTRDNIIL